VLARRRKTDADAVHDGERLARPSQLIAAGVAAEVMRRKSPVVKRAFGDRLYDLLLYVTIGVLCVAITFTVAFYGTKKGEPTSPVLLNWLGLGGVMTIVYVQAICEHRKLWKSMRFWSGLTLAVFVEIGMGTLALWSAPRLSVWLWGGFYPVNAVAVEEFLNRWLATRPAHGALRGGPTMRCS
jgi:hypothetical protein